MVSPSQQKVIDYPYKPKHILRVDAGPGSGKTFTLLKKIEHLIEKENIQPNEILVLSLTNKSVENVRANLDEKYRYSCCIKTFHSTANKLIKDSQNWVNVIDDNGWRALYQLYAPKKLKSSKTLEKSIIKYRETGELDNNDLMKILELMDKCKVYSHYDLIKNSIQYMEYSEWCKQFKVVIIDEYQDLYPFLIPFIKKISENSQLIMFGDMNQSIYQFLGNNRQAIDSIGYDEIMELKDNFRTTPEILNFINATLGLTQKLLPSNKIDSDETVLDNNNHENNQVVHTKPKCDVPPLDYDDDMIGEISKLICCGVQFKDIAILTRTNDEVSHIVNNLNKFNIPNEKILKYSKFTTTLIDIMRLSMDLKNNTDNDFNRILVLKKLCDWDLENPKIRKLDKILRKLHDIVDPIELIKTLTTISHDDLKNEPDNTIYKFTEIMKICSEDLPENMSLVEWFFERGLDVTLDSSDENSIKVSTIHASKGLEYPIVFVHKVDPTWIKPAIISPTNKKFTSGFKSEEDNVKYVAFTRARNLLYLNNTGITNHNIINNSSFWNYYYRDLKLPNKFNHSLALKNFDKIKKFLVKKL